MRPSAGTCTTSPASSTAAEIQLSVCRKRPSSLAIVPFGRSATATSRCCRCSASSEEWRGPEGNVRERLHKHPPKTECDHRAKDWVSGRANQQLDTVSDHRRDHDTGDVRLRKLRPDTCRHGLVRALAVCYAELHTTGI